MPTAVAHMTTEHLKRRCENNALDKLTSLDLRGSEKFGRFRTT